MTFSRQTHSDLLAQILKTGRPETQENHQKNKPRKPIKIFNRWKIGEIVVLWFSIHSASFKGTVHSRKKVSRSLACYISLDKSHRVELIQTKKIEKFFPVAKKIQFLIFFNSTILGHWIDQIAPKLACWCILVISSCCRSRISHFVAKNL